MLVADPIRAWYAILDASGIGDHDSSRADQAYAAWVRSGRKDACPVGPWSGGELDAWRSVLDGFRVSQRPSGQLEAFCAALNARVEARMPERAAAIRLPRQLPGQSPEAHAAAVARCKAEQRAQEKARRAARTEAAATWADVEALLPVLQELPGLESVRLPDDVADALAEQAYRAYAAAQAIEAEATRKPASVPVVGPAPATRTLACPRCGSTWARPVSLRSFQRYGLCRACRARSAAGDRVSANAGTYDPARLYVGARSLGPAGPLGV